MKKKEFDIDNNNNELSSQTMVSAINATSFDFDNHNYGVMTNISDVDNNESRIINEDRAREENIDIDLDTLLEGLGGEDFTGLVIEEEGEKVLLKVAQEIRVSVENILATRDISSAEKVEQLKLVEQESYKPLVRKLAYKKGIEEIKELAEVFKDLGYLSYALGDLSGDLKYYTDAAIFYEYEITIIEERIKPNVSDDSLYVKKIEELDKELNEIKQKMLSSVSLRVNGDNNVFTRAVRDVNEETIENKKILSELREKAKGGIERIEEHRVKSRAANNNEDNNNNSGSSKKQQEYEDAYVEGARTLFVEIASSMKGFLAKLYREAEQEIDRPPCNYTVMGLGSMALQQMTPYSDLELAILTENEEYKNSPDSRIREYFKNITHLVHLKGICLGETIIPTSRYGVDLSHLVHQAVNFDLGGKTPLGRIGKDKPYELIQTVEEMLWYVRNEYDVISHIDKNLPYILEKVCYVYGDQTLLSEYQAEVTEFLHSVNEQDPEHRLNCEIRALKILQEGIIEVNYTSLEGTHLQSNIVGDIAKLRPLSGDEEGRLFDVKRDIYRLPDRLIYNLGMHYGLQGDSAWDTVDRLKQQGIIEVEAAKHLKYAITFATTLRLKTYLHNKGQREDISIFASAKLNEQKVQEQAARMFHLSKEDLEEQDGLFKYFYTALQLHEIIEEFCDQYQSLNPEQRKSFFKESIFYKENSVSKGFIYHRLGQYKEAQNNLENVVKNFEGPYNVFMVKKTLGDLYANFGEGNKAIEQLEYCFYKREEISESKKSAHYKSALSCVIGITTLDSLGKAYISIGAYDESIKHSILSLDSLKELVQIDAHPFIADSLNNLGWAYLCARKYDLALDYFNQSLNMSKIIHKDILHPSIARSLNNLGIIYINQEKYDEAIDFFIRSLDIQKLIHKEEPHPNIAFTLNNLGDAYRLDGKYGEAIDYFTRSLDIYKATYHEESYPDIIRALNNLGAAYFAQDRYDQAVEYYIQSLILSKKIFLGELHPNIATSLNGLGDVYAAIKMYDKAIDFYNQSLNMNRTIYKERLHLDIALSLNNLAIVYSALGRFAAAIDCNNQSLDIKKEIFQEKAHPDIVISLTNLGETYKAIGKYQEALDYFNQSLNMSKIIYKDKPHPYIAGSLINLGNAFYDTFDYKKAIIYYNQSLEMLIGMYEREALPHPYLPIVLNNLAEIYTFTEGYEQAIKYYKNCLTIQKIIYKDKISPEIANSLWKLGEIYTTMKNFTKAIENLLCALHIINILENHPYQTLIMNSFIKSVQAFTSKYLIASEDIIKKITNYTKEGTVVKEGMLFTDYRLHYQQALLLQQKPESKLEDIVAEYKLALIFAPKEEVGIRQEIYQNLTFLTGVIQKRIELWLALGNEDIKEIKQLINTKLDLNIPFNGITPLIQGVTGGNKSIVSALLEMGANINKPNEYKATPLYCSLGFYSQSINIDVVNLLLDKGADVNQPMYDGDTPMHMAHYKGNKEAIKLLLEYKANINAKNGEGKTPLHCLLDITHFETKTKLEIIEEFLGKYDKSIQDKDGRTVIDYAKEHCKEALLLLGYDLKSDLTLGNECSKFNLTEEVKEQTVDQLTEEEELQLAMNMSLTSNKISTIDSSSLLGKIDNLSTLSSDFA